MPADEHARGTTRLVAILVTLVLVVSVVNSVSLLLLSRRVDQLEQLLWLLEGIETRDALVVETRGAAKRGPTRPETDEEMDAAIGQFVQRWSLSEQHRRQLVDLLDEHMPDYPFVSLGDGTRRAELSDVPHPLMESLDDLLGAVAREDFLQSTL